MVSNQLRKLATWKYSIVYQYSIESYTSKYEINCLSNFVLWGKVHPGVRFAPRDEI